MQKTFILLLLFILTYANAWDRDLFDGHIGASDTVIVHNTEFKLVVDNLLREYGDQGFWDAQIEIIDNAVGTDSSLITIVANPGAFVSVEKIHFSGVPMKDQDYLRQEYLLGRATISSQSIDQAQNRLTTLGYHFYGKKQISRDGQGIYHLSYSVKDRPELNVDALAAFNQSSGADTVAWFGHVNLYVPNLDGRGKSIQLNWKRLRTNSESFLFGYEHPWLFGIPLKAQLRFGREVVDGNYQVIQVRAGLDWNLDWDRSLIFQYENRQSVITHSGAQINPEWRSTQRQLLGLGYRQTNLDQTEHRGLELRTAWDRELNFEPASVSRLMLRTEAEIALSARIYISQKTAFMLQNEITILTDPSVLEPLGGVNSVRGYAENYLRSPSVISLQHDLHLALGSQSQLLAFFDLGMYYESATVQHLIGYGIGVQLRSGPGPIRLILATHAGLNLRNSFLHIEYSRGISWIDQ